jgi:hypothetical protein
VFPGGTEEQHLALAEALGEAQTHAPGRILFAAGPVADGWQIIQVWERRDQLESWVEAHLGAAFAEVGSRGYPAPPRITDLELTDLHVGPTVVASS